MQEYKIILTWEAIYDVTDIADYIEEEFGQQRADRFQSDLKEQMQNLGQFSTAFPRTQILYRGYSIHKRSFPPSIIFYIIILILVKLYSPYKIIFMPLCIHIIFIFYCNFS